MHKIIYVDVDDTLVRSAGSKRIPMPGVVADARALHAAGAEMYLWSTGGADYARDTARHLQIEHCFVAFLPKPTAYIDDQAVSEWRYCMHVLPGGARDA